MLAFVDNPLTHANFEALMASTKKTRVPNVKTLPDTPERPEPLPS